MYDAEEHALVEQATDLIFSADSKQGMRAVPENATMLKRGCLRR
jgi:hypothetical protein